MKKTAVLGIIGICAVTLLYTCSIVGFKLAGTKWKCSFTNSNIQFDWILNFTSDTEAETIQWEDSVEVFRGTFTYNWNAETMEGIAIIPQDNNTAQFFNMYLNTEKNILFTEYSGLAFAYKANN